MHETAFAKLNLALHVRERMPDGYHRIETLYAFCEDGDRLSVAKSGDLDLEIGGPFGAALAADSDNLVLRAALALRDRYRVKRGARLKLDKRLPVSAGIGGGSADAAAALRLLVRWWRLEPEQAVLLDIAAGLGADVPACLLSTLARGDGRGDRLTPRFENLSGTPVLLVNPCVPLSTAEVFDAWDGLDRGPLRDWREGRNDLEPAAIGLAPEVAEALAALESADFARMSGSGATCFGLFASKKARDRAGKSIAQDHPQWWVLASRLK